MLDCYLEDEIYSFWRGLLYIQYEVSYPDVELKKGYNSKTY